MGSNENTLLTKLKMILAQHEARKERRRKKEKLKTAIENALIRESIKKHNLEKTNENINAELRLINELSSEFEITKLTIATSSDTNPNDAEYQKLKKFLQSPRLCPKCAIPMEVELLKNAEVSSMLVRLLTYKSTDTDFNIPMGMKLEFHTKCVRCGYSNKYTIRRNGDE